MLRLPEITLFSSDQAENSIMQTITIAVSAILIAAGLVTAPGLINNARDNNARIDLANIAYIQSFAISKTGRYYEGLFPGDPDYIFEAVDPDDVYETGFTFSISGGITDHTVITCNGADGWGYLAYATSSSGTTFYRASGSGLTVSDHALLDIPDGCEP
jgi:hypothetical protein